MTVTANKLNATKGLDTPASIQAISGDVPPNAGVSGIMDVAAEIRWARRSSDLDRGDKKYVIRAHQSH